MACGCKDKNSKSSGSFKNSSGIGASLSEVIDGNRKLTLLEVVQFIAGIITIVGFVKFINE